MNFIVANVDFGKAFSDTRGIPLRQLADGFPDGWNRPGLIDSYRKGISEGVFNRCFARYNAFLSPLDGTGFSREQRTL